LDKADKLLGMSSSAFGQAQQDIRLSGG